MSNEKLFRSTDDEVKNVLLQLSEIKDTIRELSGKVSRIETHVRRAFPIISSQVQTMSTTKLPSVGLKTRKDLLNLFDELVVKMNETASNDAVTGILKAQGLENLRLMAKELGISLGKRKPSVNLLTMLVMGKMNESRLLSKHDNFSQPHSMLQNTPSKLEGGLPD